MERDDYEDEDKMSMDPEPMQKETIRIDLENMFELEAVEREKNTIQKIFKIVKKKVIDFKTRKAAISNSPFFKAFCEDLKKCSPKRYNLMNFKKLFEESIQN